MHIELEQVTRGEIKTYRKVYRQEMGCQIVHDSLHARGFTHMFHIRVDGQFAGYGAVMGYGDEPKDTVVEFFVVPHRRAHALELFRKFLAVTEARAIHAQTNDRLLSLLLFDCATDIRREKILFADASSTSLPSPDVTFRETTDEDRREVFRHQVEPVGDWLLEQDGEIVATGGILTHYNPPYGDIFVEVAEPHRRRGLGSYLVQELKRTAGELGYVPVARCPPENLASRAMLQKAGLLPHAMILSGTVIFRREP